MENLIRVLGARLTICVPCLGNDLPVVDHKKFYCANIVLEAHFSSSLFSVTMYDTIFLT